MIGTPLARQIQSALSPTAAAVHTPEKRFVAVANGRNPSRCAHALSSAMNSGVPGGCGMPSVFAAAMNSPASQNVTLGASVAT